MRRCLRFGFNGGNRRRIDAGEIERDGVVLEYLLQHVPDAIGVDPGILPGLLIADRGQYFVPTLVEQDVDFLAMALSDPPREGLLDFRSDVVFSIGKARADVFPANLVGLFENFLQQLPLETANAHSRDEHRVLAQVKDKEDNEKNGEEAYRKEERPHRGREREESFIYHLARVSPLSGG